jgi:MYXO-CTERM domain-containing protein
VEVAGTQNDITFSGGIGAAIEIQAKAGKCSVTKATSCFVDGDCPEGETCKGVAPNCTVNPDIDKTGTSFAFQPPNCQGEACTGIRALVLSLSNTDAIPSGSVLYSCLVDIKGTASSGTTYPLTCSNAGSSDPDGVALSTKCTDGGVTVGTETPSTTLSADIDDTTTIIPVASTAGFPTSGAIQIGDEIITYTGIEGNTFTGATRGAAGTTAAAHSAGAAVTQVASPATPTPTSTPTVTETPSVGVTATSTATPTNTKKATNTPGGSTGHDDDGCAVTAPASSASGWMLLLPAAALLWIRRRSK